MQRFDYATNLYKVSRSLIELIAHDVNFTAYVTRTIRIVASENRFSLISVPN